MRAAAVLALALLAGCAAPAGTDGPIGGAAPVIELVHGIIDARLDGDQEPLLAAAPDGTLYAATTLGQPRVFVSEDDGASFTERTYAPTQAPLASPPDGGADGSLVADAAGALHWIGLRPAGVGIVVDEGVSIVYQRSEDKAASWSQPQTLARGIGNIAPDRPWLSVSPDGRALVVAWRDRSAALYAARSTDGGATWDAPATISEADSVLPGPIVAWPDNRTFQLAFTRETDAPENLWLATTRDAGTSWSATPIGGSWGVMPVLARDEAGALYVAYEVGDDVPANDSMQQLGIEMRVSRDDGATWEAPMRISPREQKASLPWIVAGGPGRVALAWYQADEGGSREDPGVWRVAIAMSEDATGTATAPRFGSATTDVIHRGKICNQCREPDTSRADHLGLALTEAGVVVVFVEDRGILPGDLSLGATIAHIVR